MKIFVFSFQMNVYLQNMIVITNSVNEDQKKKSRQAGRITGRVERSEIVERGRTTGIGADMTVMIRIENIGIAIMMIITIETIKMMAGTRKEVVLAASSGIAIMSEIDQINEIEIATNMMIDMIGTVVILEITKKEIGIMIEIDTKRIGKVDKEILMLFSTCVCTL